VFGRVIEGMDVVNSLTLTHESGGFGEQPIPDAQPDTIKIIEIVRDRGHEYEPTVISTSEEGENAPKDDSDPPPVRPDSPSTESTDSRETGGDGGGN
jgi:hypothetical protein